MYNYILNEILWLIKLSNKDIESTVLHDIYIALEYKGRNLHNISWLFSYYNETNYTPEMLV